MALRILNTSLVKGGEFFKMCRTDNILIVTKEKKKSPRNEFPPGVPVKDWMFTTYGEWRPN